MEHTLVNVILITFTGATFATGFWAGKKYGTYGAMAQAARDWVKSL